MQNDNTPNDAVPRPVGRPPAPPPLRDPPPALREDYQALGKPLTMLSVAEGVLKTPARIMHELHHGRARTVTTLQLAIALICLLAYGLTVGTFSLGTQLWAAPVKIAIGVLFSALICLPSLFVFSCLAGADSDPAKILGALSGLVTVAALLLLALCPVSWIFAQSTESIVFMGFLNVVFWLIAAYYGLQFLKKSVLLLNGRGGQHLAVWSLIFIVVSLQMTTTLRPILGTSERVLQTEKKFFLTHWIDQLDEAAKAPKKK
jgi:hypothetical protein